jgi:twitching motility protein PilU
MNHASGMKTLPEGPTGSGNPVRASHMEREQAARFLRELLTLMHGKDGSDLFITADFPPAIKIDGKLTPVSAVPLTAQHALELARATMSDRQAAEFEARREVNFAISPQGIGRFRVNVFMQLGRVGMVVRTIRSTIPRLSQLELPAVIAPLALQQRGLVLVVGGTGSGKSTTLAAMIGHRNEHSHGHIITIEDPVEFVHPHRNCIVTHREIGVDTDSWDTALRNSLRQAPDVIMIGEIRDRETMEHAISFAETGHLCLATLHANNSNQALDRIINFFPEERRSQLLMDLSLNLRGIVSQRLIPLESGTGRVPAVEVLLDSPLLSDLIFKGDVTGIREVMKKSREIGMQTFDQALFDLFESGRISLAEALRHADSVNDLRLTVKLQSKREQHDPFEGTTRLGIL